MGLSVLFHGPFCWIIRVRCAGRDALLVYSFLHLYKWGHFDLAEIDRRGLVDCCWERRLFFGALKY